DAVVIDNEFRVLGEGKAGASNPIIVGLESATQAIAQAIGLAILTANISLSQVKSAFLGIAGVEHPDGLKSSQEAIRTALPGLKFQLGTDARVALAGATDL